MPSRRFLTLFLAPAAVLTALAGAAYAATTTSTFQVQITIASACTIVSTATLNFGSQGVLTAAVNNTSTLNVQCTNTTPYNVGLDAGQGTGATVAARKMTGGAATVTYTIYQDSGRTTVWGNTIGTNTVTGTGNGASQALTLYGQVPAQTTPAPASYSDTVTVTVTY